MLLVWQCKLLGTLEINISKILGFFVGEDSQQVGPGGERMLKLFVLTKLCKVMPRGLFERQPQALCLALKSPPMIKLFLMQLKQSANVVFEILWRGGE